MRRHDTASAVGGRVTSPAFPGLGTGSVPKRTSQAGGAAAAMGRGGGHSPGSVICRDPLGALDHWPSGWLRVMVLGTQMFTLLFENVLPLRLIP
jgi:hypothetical protein